MITVSSILPAAAAVACGLLLLRGILSFKSILFLLGRCWRLLDEKAQAYQIYKIPQHADNGQHNPLYRRAAAYVASLPSLEDSDLAHIFSTGRKPNDFFFQPDPTGRPVADSFRGARLHWAHHPGCLHLRVRRQDRHRVLRPYLQHVESVADEIEIRRKEVKLFTNKLDDGENWWRSVPFTHPSTFDTVAMDPELKARVKADLESFLKGRNYYARLGRVWKRSYLLHGPPGTGKSTFVAAMAKFLCYDVYDLDLSKISEGTDLKSLLLQTSPKSVILVEDLDRYLTTGNKEEVAAMLSFMDGVFSCCGEERVMVFTMSGKEEVDPAVLRPGRLDVHIHFPLCDFSAFKTLASSYLGLKDHKLYPQVSEGFQSGAQLSPAEVGEIMIANRGSPSRALKTVINALHQASPAAAVGIDGGGRRTMSEGGSVEELEGCGIVGGGGGFGFGKDATVREFKKLYGLIRRSGGKGDGTMSVEMAAAAAAAANAAAAAAANAAAAAASAGHSSHNGCQKDGL